MRMQWTSEIFDQELKKITDGLGRMPTNSELQQLGRCDLANQITKRGGFAKNAQSRGLSQVASDSSFGWEGEVEASRLMMASGFVVERSTAVRWPFDLLVNDCVRVDVKTAKYAEYGPSKGWFYRIGKSPQADVIFLLQSDTGSAYIMHWLDCPSSNITISRDGGKYARFKDNYNLIAKLVISIQEFRKTTTTT